MTHMQPLARDASPELTETFALFERILGFVPNSLLTMQRRTKIVDGFGALTRAVMDPTGAVDPGFKRLIAHFASAARSPSEYSGLDRYSHSAASLSSAMPWMRAATSECASQ